MELIIISALAIGVLWLSYSAYKSYVAAKAAKEAREESDRIAEEKRQDSIFRTNDRIRQFYAGRTYSAKQSITPASSVSRPVETNSGAYDPMLTYLILSQSIQPNSYSSNPYPHSSSFPVGGGGTFDGAGASSDWSSSSSPSSSSSCDSSSSYSSDSSSSSSDSSSSCSSSD